jgi:flagellar biosynthesis/type III secretory pathway protein FliH
MISEEAKRELEKMLMESYDRGVADATEAAMKALEVGINKAVTVEREACAEICDGISDYYETRTDLNQTHKQVGQLAAEVCGVRIRERVKNNGQDVSS